MRHAVDILGSGMGIYESGGGSSIIYEYDNSYRHKVEYIDDTSAGNYTLEDETYTETERVSGAVTGSGQVMTAFASGRNESDSSVGVYCAGFARASGSVPTERVKDWSRTYQYGVAPAETETGTETTTYTRTSDVNLRSPAPYRTSFTDLAPGPFTQTTVTASMTGANSWGYTDFVDPEDPSYTWSNSVVATHERTQYSGTGKPSALIDTGWTHIVRTTVDPDSGTTVEDTWYSDPDGSVYEGLYDEFGIDFAESTLPSPSLSDYGSNRSSTRTETVTKRTEIFGE